MTSSSNTILQAPGDGNSQEKLVSVVIPHFNDLAGLDLCLGLLERQSLARDTFEIIVVDNGSSAGPEAVERVVAGRATLVFESKRGAAHARNAGVARASGPIIAFTDSDCLPDPDWLRRGVEAVASYPVIGGRVVVTVRNPQDPTAVEAFESIFAFHNDRYVKRLGFSVTANLVVSTDVFRRTEGFRDGVSEDREWCIRAARHGFPVRYDESVTVGHPARHDWDELKRKWRRLTRESYLLTLEEPAGWTRWLLRSMATLFSPFAHLPRVLWHRPLSLSHRFAAAGVMFRIRIYRCLEGLRLAMSPR